MFQKSTTTLVSSTSTLNKSDGGNNEESKVKNKAALFPQIAATFVMNLCALSSGLAAGYPAVSLPEIRADDTIKATMEQGSWIASLTAMGSACGCLFTTFISDRLGRKRTVMIGTLPQIAGCILIGAAPNVESLYAGRYLCGLGIGFQTTLRLVYISEVTQPRLRGLASSSNILCWTSGMLIVYTLGILLHWRTVAYVLLSVPVLLLTCLFFLPESPAWLASKGRAEDAEQALRKYRGKKYDMTEELVALNRRIDEAKAKGNMSFLQSLREVMTTAALKPLGIVVTLYFVRQFCGSSVIFTYAVDIFQDLNGSVDKHAAALTVAGVQVILNVITIYLIYKFSKRTLLICSACGLAVMMFGLGAYVYIDVQRTSNGAEGLSYRWLPAAIIWIYLVFVIPGVLSIPHILLGEIFPLRGRGLLSCFAGFCYYMLYFLSVKTYPTLLNAIHNYGVYWLFGSVGVFGAFFAYIFVPETKDKTLDEIENAMVKQNPADETVDVNANKDEEVHISRL